MREKPYLLIIVFVVMVNMVCLNMNNFITQKWNIPYIITGNSINLQKVCEEGHTKQDNHSVFTRKIIAKENYPVTVSRSYKINNENICRGIQRVSTIVMVHTAPKHFKRRQVMRETMLNTTYYSPESIRVVFLLGLVSEEKIQMEIEYESRTYKDIVQGYFDDTYRNLTNKGVMGYKWISEYCMNAEFVTKIDDDVFINFFKVFEEMYEIKNEKKYIQCNRINKNSMRIERNKRSKWYIEKDEYKRRRTYPHTYCSGLAVFLSTDLIPMLCHAAIGSPFFWVDDFYLFGLLPSKIPGVMHQKLNSKLTFNFRNAIKCYVKYGRKCQHIIVYIPAHGDMGDRGFERMWYAVVKDRIQSTYGNYYMELPPIPHRKAVPLQPAKTLT